MKKTLLCLVATLFISPVFADVHKWKDAEGKTHYGDAPPIANTATVKVDKQTDDQIDNGERIKAETGNSTMQETARDPKCEALLDQLHNTPQTIAGLMNAKAIRQEIELRCMSSADRQALEQKRANAQKQQNTSCTNDAACGIGKRCVKPPMQSTGTCMKTVDQYGQDSEPRIESLKSDINMKGECSSDWDCSSGFKCDSKYKACVK